MFGFFDPLKEAWKEIAYTFIILDSLYLMQSAVVLDNLWRTGQISLNEYLIRFISFFIINPAIQAIAIVLITHWILDSFFNKGND